MSHFGMNMYVVHIAGNIYGVIWWYVFASLNTVTLKLLSTFKIWSYRIVFDVIKNVCKLFDDRMFNNLVIINLTFYSCI